MIHSSEAQSPHRPVLLEAALRALNVQPEGVYVDATFGRGGHTEAILQRLRARGSVIAVDKDPEAVEAGKALAARDGRLTVLRGSFAMLEPLIETRDLSGKVDGILFDLGVSSPQLEDPQRGFSFQHDGPLDMRMDPGTGISAADWLARAPEEEIAQVLRDYGEERYARRIARAIVRARKERPIRTTRVLADLVSRTNPTREKNKHPATRTFQAIRIYINHELEELTAGLEQAVRVLAHAGRLVVISFHSLEDRLVKRFIRDRSRGAPLPRGMPAPAQPFLPVLRAVGKPIRPEPGEMEANPRCRSAVLRIAEKL